MNDSNDNPRSNNSDQIECFQMTNSIQSEYIQIECFRMTNFIQSGHIQIECFWVRCLYSMAVNARAGSESDDESSEDGCVEEPLDGVDDEGS